MIDHVRRRRAVATHRMGDEKAGARLFPFAAVTTPASIGPGAIEAGFAFAVAGNLTGASLARRDNLAARANAGRENGHRLSRPTQLAQCRQAGFDLLGRNLCRAVVFGCFVYNAVDGLQLGDKATLGDKDFPWACCPGVGGRPT